MSEKLESKTANYNWIYTMVKAEGQDPAQDLKIQMRIESCF
jgi:hypothetical protein